MAIYARLSRREFSQPGTHSFLVPTEGRSITIYAFGAGGSGGDNGGGGGGAGAFVVASFVVHPTPDPDAVVSLGPAMDLTIVIGAGGTGRAGRDGRDGGDTRVVYTGIDLVVAGGGRGGARGAPISTKADAGLGGQATALGLLIGTRDGSAGRPGFYRADGSGVCPGLGGTNSAIMVGTISPLPPGVGAGGAGGPARRGGGFAPSSPPGGASGGHGYSVIVW